METSVHTSLSKKLRFLRKSNDIKQAIIASEIGISQQEYSDLENGKKNFTDETIEKLAAYFKITPAEFERPIETVYISNNHNHSGIMNANNNSWDMVQSLITSKEEVIATQKELLSEKNLRIKLLEELLNNKQ
jgi:transcriptional regulator with XRE-family HTH domain